MHTYIVLWFYYASPCPYTHAMALFKSSLARQLGERMGMNVNQMTKEVRSIAPFLVPFLKMVCIYFVLWLPSNPPTVTATFVKCLPVLSLIWFVWLQGVSSEIENSYNRKILAGLVFSCLGDAFLVWQENHFVLFLAGMGSFGLAHLFYTSAFGFSPFGLKEFLFSCSVLAGLFSFLLPCVTGVLLYAVVVYGLLIGLMGWRALARFTLRGEIPWRKVYAACGALLFVLSDSFLAVNKFCWPVPAERVAIMTTYYAAQLCISLSVINSRPYLQGEKEGCSVCRRRREVEVNPTS